MRDAVTTILEILGFAAVAFGLGLAWLPLGVIAAGVALVVIGYLEGSTGPRRRDVVSIEQQILEERA